MLLPLSCFDSSIYLSHDRFLNALEALGGSSWLAQNVGSKTISHWSHPLGALIIGIRQIGLSGWGSEECTAIESELFSWLQKGLHEREGTSYPVLCFDYLRIGYTLIVKCLLLSMSLSLAIYG